MKIWTSPYALQPRRPASEGGRDARRGALLRVETAAGVGHADLHPWPELGDEPLDAQLESLRAGRPLRLAARALAWSEVDAAARSLGKSAFEGLRIPPSHFLAVDMGFVGREMIGALEGDGYRAVKLKVGRDPAREIEALSRLGEEPESAVRLRLDFNARLDAEGARAFIASLPRSVRERVEFIEDPCAFAPAAWKALSASTAPVALDRAAGAAVAFGAITSGAVDVLVVKPAIDDAHDAVSTFVTAVSGPNYAVVTSYLDHPFGQMTAAFSAATLAGELPGRIGVCGLLSHSAYEPSGFSEALRQRGPNLMPAEGTGFGFDGLLEPLEWRELKA